MDLYYNADASVAEDDIKDRLLFRQVIEALKCLETNVLRTVADGNIGSIMGIGAPALDRRPDSVREHLWAGTLQCALCGAC
jgi:hypothetical protein